MIKKIFSVLLDWYMPIVMSILTLFSFYNDRNVMWLSIAIFGIVGYIALVISEKHTDKAIALADEAIISTEDLCNMLEELEDDIEKYIKENIELKIKIIELQAELKQKGSH